MPPIDVPPSFSAKSVGSEWTSPPAPGEIEFTLFGPGFGECGLVHIGDGRWIIIDSCVPADSDEPVAITYLRQFGFDPATAIECIIATHWHDDHVRGIGALVEVCPTALFVCSSAMATGEFKAMVQAFDGQRLVQAGSGVKEVNRVFDLLRAPSRRVPRRASAGRPLWHASENTFSHRRPVIVTALSPSDKDYELSLKAIGKLMPRERETQYRCPAEKPNLMSVVAHISIGPICMLLGADLEHVNDVTRGWRAVLQDPTLPRERASVFKISHHGAESGYASEIWDIMLECSPFAVASPWQRGGHHLPQASDVIRIVGHTENAYLTAVPRVGQSPVNRPAAVSRQLREMGARITRLEPAIGAVRFRRNLNDPGTWSVQLNGAAFRLSSPAAA